MFHKHSNKTLLELKKGQKDLTPKAKQQLNREIAYRKEYGLMRGDAGKKKTNRACSSNPFGGIGLW